LKSLQRRFTKERFCLTREAFCIGNYYSITNDYDNPSRVFFCQACEISPAQYEASQMSVGA
jgi:hypothetical protein